MAENLVDVLKEEKQKGLITEDHDAFVADLFDQMEKEEARVEEQLRTPWTPSDRTWVNPDNLYHISQIKAICVRYRLRFLDADRFKGKIPVEAKLKLGRFHRQGKDLSGFKIIAPAKLFKLDEKDKDPLLFAQLDKDHYYFIHQWGKDLNPLRKWLVWPLRSFQHAATTLVVLAAILASLAPVEAMGAGGSSFLMRGFLFFYLLIALTSWSMLYGFALVKNFNNALWNSKYFD